MSSVKINHLPPESEYKEWINWLETHVGAKFGQDTLTAYGDGWKLIFCRSMKDNDYESYYELYINKKDSKRLQIWFLLMFSK